MKQDDFDIPEVFRRAMEEAGWRLEPEDDQGGRPPRRPLPPPDRSPRFNRYLLVFALLLLLLFFLSRFASYYTDWLWFDHLGFRDIFVRRFRAILSLFTAGFVFTLTVLLGNWMMARRRAMREAAPFNQQTLGSTTILWLIIAAGVFLAFLFASGAAGQWEQVLVYLNAQPFGTSEPIFGRDIGFYIFALPVLRFAQGWLLTLLLVTLIGLVPIYALPNLPDIQRGVWRPFRSKAFRQHVSLVAGLLLLVWAAGYILDAFGLLYSPRGVAFGASYVDMRAGIWALRLQFIFLVLTAAALFYNVFRPSPRLPLIPAALWLAATLVVGGLLPGLLQRYVVEPNELTLEEPYIANNIAFTRSAFNLDRIETTPFGRTSSLSPEDLLENEEVLRNIRLWDYRPLQQTYQQLQGLRPYYFFNEVDIDRYNLDGDMRQVMLAVRELDKSRLPAPSWVNRNLEFTHGYGVVMNPVNEFTRDGQPQFFIQDLPPQSNIPLEVTRPEIYFGELTNDTVYVSSGREEFSYPSGEENVYSSYAGTGGIVLDSALKRLAFAVRQSDPNVLLSSDITDSTRVQYRRQIQERIRELTPFLMLDADPYIVVTEDGRLVWLQDAYTVSQDYPYSTPIRVAVRSSVGPSTPALEGAGVPTRSINYMRNSVKVTVDAYDGTVTYYISDPTDPVINAYAQAFPGLLKPLEEMPDDLRRHIRYPVDYLWAQARQYATYHMTDVRVFYNKEDLWQIPTEIRDNAEQLIEPYYVILPLPGSQESEYLLILPFNPATRNNMIAWMAARNDPEHYGQLKVYELPKQELVFGPLQIEGRINQEPTISQQFTLWDQRGSNVIRGNLLVLPINNSFLYVEPVYLLSDTSALPELKRIVTASNTSVAMAETLDQSLRALARGSGTVVEGSEPAPSGGVTIPSQLPSGVLLTLDELVVAANNHLRAAEEAQRRGDWATYGAELEALRATLQQLVALTSEPQQ